MADLPIPFTAPMVQALLREIEKPGTGKTQTRRIVRPQPQLAAHHEPVRVEQRSERGWVWMVHTDRPSYQFATGDWREPYAVGDRLYVREAWRVSKSHDAIKPRDLRPRIMTMLYEAGGSMGGVTEAPKKGERAAAEYIPDAAYPLARPDWAGKLRPGMFLPRWGSRITLLVEEVRVQRLQDISEEDAEAEGIEREEGYWRDYLMPSTQICVEAVDSYRTLWASINGPGSWDANPWVASYTFRPFLSNIDAMETRDAKA